MGVNLGPLLNSFRKPIKLSDLRDKCIALDAYNMIYQFLTAIRDSTGRPLRDRKGRITSHLSGLFYRTINLLKEGIKVIYVFDGKPPPKKMKELERRKLIKTESYKKYIEAIEKGMIDEARKYAAMAASLEDYMIESSIKLLELMGVGVIIAPSEGEAQASHIAMKGDAYAVGSQDYDSLLFGAPRVIRNITLTGTRWYPSKGIEVKLEPEMFVLEEILSKLKITREMLVDISILIGTDYNEGIKGIGPKKAYELIKTYKAIEKIPGLRDKISIDEVEEVRQIFLNPEVTDEYEVKFRETDFEGLKRLLCDEYDFNIERVESALRELRESTSIKRLTYWFK
ncbi:MAG: flap endonuclease-1 [Candidatus Geothermarchaeota archaeon]